MNLSVPPAAGRSVRSGPDRLRLLAAQLIAEIDDELTKQVNAILHHPAFQRLEASWRGLRYLVEQVAQEVEEAAEEDAWEAAPGQVVVRMLDLAWPELCNDLGRAIDTDQSNLFARIYTDEFDMPGGKPFGVLLGDYEIRHRPGGEDRTDDIAALGAVGGIAAAAFAPFIAAAAPEFLQLRSFRDLPPDPAGVFEESDYAAWHRLRNTQDARFVALALPRVLARLPYSGDGTRADLFRFTEDTSASDARSWLWGTPVHAVGTVLARAFLRYGWFGRIHGIERGAISAGLVNGLPFAEFPTDRRTEYSPWNLSAFADAQPAAPRIVTEVALLEEQAGLLAEQGFLPLSAVPQLPLAAFLSTQTIQRPERYDRQAATASARLSAKLGYILCASRFAHCLKVIGRSKLGLVATPAEHQRFLQNWLRQYCSGNDDLGEEMRARYPLRDASVELQEVPGKPGALDCLIHLQPHFQFEDAVAVIRLATELRSIPFTESRGT